MELASRVLSVLIGLGVIAFVLWPVADPLGFGEAWRTRPQAQRSQNTAPDPQTAPAKEAASELDSEKAAQRLAPAAALLGQANAPPNTPEAVQRRAQAPAEEVAALPKDSVDAAALPPATKTFYRVRVRDGGTIEAGGIVIKLRGITAREANTTCKDTRGKTWSCGAAAKAALARLIRARAITCTLTSGGQQNAIEASCSVGGTDLSAWMVRQGWAEPKEHESALVQAAEAAKAEEIGVWRVSP
jgi:endonuclease YncB( thermonuclease family)